MPNSIKNSDGQSDKPFPSTESLAIANAFLQETDTERRTQTASLSGLQPSALVRYISGLSAPLRESIPLLPGASEMPLDEQQKESNPKDSIAGNKLDLGLVPDTAVIALAEAMTEGAIKYGRYNWRLAGVRAHVYHAACRRHLAKWWGGQDCDPTTGISHLSSALACLAILVDARFYDTLTDDRPPAPNREDLPHFIDFREALVKSLKEQHKDKSPYQPSIKDTP